MVMGAGARLGVVAPVVAVRPAVVGTSSPAISAPSSALSGMRGQFVAEGLRLLPSLVKPLLAVPGYAVWLLPTPEFRQARRRRAAGDGCRWWRTPVGNVFDGIDAKDVDPIVVLGMMIAATSRCRGARTS